MTFLTVKFIILLCLIQNILTFHRHHHFQRRNDEFSNVGGGVNKSLETAPNLLKYPPPFSYDQDSPNGPKYWYRTAPACGGTLQSPISIKSGGAVTGEPASKLKITNWSDSPLKVLLENSGHTIKLIFTYESTEVPTMRGGPLTNCYKLVEVHYHFAQQKKAGSEHVIDGHKFAAEAHMVFYNSKYGTFKKAQNKADGLAVIGRFFEVSDSFITNYGFAPYLRHIRTPDSSYKIRYPTFSLRSLFGPLTFGYYTYEGSLTTPPCYESVTWIVISKPLKIYERELQDMQALKGYHGTLAPNFRPLQGRNNRRVEFFNNI